MGSTVLKAYNNRVIFMEISPRPKFAKMAHFALKRNTMRTWLTNPALWPNTVILNANRARTARKVWLESVRKGTIVQDVISMSLKHALQASTWRVKMRRSATFVPLERTVCRVEWRFPWSVFRGGLASTKEARIRNSYVLAATSVTNLPWQIWLIRLWGTFTSQICVLKVHIVLMGPSRPLLIRRTNKRLRLVLRVLSARKVVIRPMEKANARKVSIARKAQMKWSQLSLALLLLEPEIQVQVYVRRDLFRTKSRSHLANSVQGGTIVQNKLW